MSTNRKKQRLISCLKYEGLKWNATNWYWGRVALAYPYISEVWQISPGIRGSGSDAVWSVWCAPQKHVQAAQYTVQEGKFDCTSGLGNLQQTFTGMMENNIRI
jgi:hypothetical protein